MVYSFSFMVTDYLFLDTRYLMLACDYKLSLDNDQLSIVIG